VNRLPWSTAGDTDIKSGSQEWARLYAALGGCGVEIVHVDSRDRCNVATQGHFDQIHGSTARLPVFERPNEEALCHQLHPRRSITGIEAVVASVKERK